MIIGIDRQRQSYLQMNARKEEQKNGKAAYLKLDLNAGSKFAGMKLDETKKICDMSISGGTKLNPLNPSAKVYTEEELEEIRRKKREEQPKSTLVDGVEFTFEKLKECEAFANKITSSFRMTGGSLDYEDYAKMGIASSIMNTYAKEKLNEEQAKVVHNSIENFFNTGIKKEKDRQKNDPYCYIDNTEGVGPTGELNKYYAVKSRWSVKEAEEFKAFVKSSGGSEYDKESLCAHADYIVKVGATEQSASNAEHAQKIRTLFQNMDIMDEASVKNAFEQYEILMTPVYKAAGLQNSYFDTRVNEIVGDDVKKFISQIASGKAAISTAGTKVDFVA